MRSTETAKVGRGFSQTVGGGDIAAGGGSGGILVYLVNTYVTDSALHTLLLYTVPTVSVAAMGLYNYGLRRWQKWREDVEIRKASKQIIDLAQTQLAKAKATLREVEADNHATDEHKKAIRLNVEAFERTVLDLNVQIAILPNSGIQPPGAGLVLNPPRPRRRRIE